MDRGLKKEKKKEKKSNEFERFAKGRIKIGERIIL